MKMNKGFLVFCFLLGSSVATLTSFNDHEEYGKGKPNLVELAAQLNLTKFVEALKATGADRIINHEGPYTVFAPTDAAFENEKRYPNEDNDRDKILFHIGRGKVAAADLKNELTLRSTLSKRDIRINIYDKATTANGRPIVSTDHAARNGYIHVISEVMSSVYSRAGSVISEMEDCCPQHSMFLELVKHAELYKTLDTFGPITLLAPNNGAFAELHPDFIIHLKRNLTMLRTVLMGHVLPGTWYSPGLQDGQTFKTLAGTRLPVRIQGNGVRFGKAGVTLADVTAGNGAVHAIDEVLFPKGLEAPRLRNLVDVCRDAGFTSFARALESTGVARVLNHEGRFTVFAPDNEAFDQPRRYPVQASLKERVQFHVARGVVRPEAIANEETARTMLSKRDVRFNVYEGDKVRLLTANGRIVEVENRHLAHNGEVIGVKEAFDYVYERNGTLWMEMQRNPRFRKFAAAMQKFGLDSVLDNAKNTFTVLVPNDSALEGIDVTVASAVDLLKTHIAPGTWYSHGLETSKVLVTFGGARLNVNAVPSGGMTIGQATIVSSDYTTMNGVLHEVDRLLI